MKKLIFLLSLCAMSCTADMTDIPDPAGSPGVAVSFSAYAAPLDAASLETRSDSNIPEAVGGSAAINDINIYLFNAKQCYHLYSRDGQAQLPNVAKGSYTLCILGNIGCDMEELGQYKAHPDYLNTLTTEELDIEPDSRLLLTGMQEVVISDGTASFDMELSRLIARHYFNVSVTSEFQSQITLLSAQLCNIPSYAYLFPVDDNYAPYPDSSAGNAKMKLATTPSSITDCVYTYENVPEEVPEITSPRERNAEKAPVSATYLSVLGQLTDGTFVSYTVYLGENTTTNFAFHRNTSRQYNIIIQGSDPEDLRVETTWATAQPETTAAEYTGAGYYNIGLFSFHNSSGNSASLNDKCLLSIAKGSYDAVIAAGGYFEYASSAADTSWKRAGSNTFGDYRTTYCLRVYLPEKAFLWAGTAWPVSMLYGDAANNIVLGSKSCKRIFYTYLTFRCVGMDSSDMSLNEFIYAGTRFDEVDLDGPRFQFWSNKSGDVDLSFYFDSRNYTFDGLCHADGERMDINPYYDDYQDTGTVVYSGVSSDEFVRNAPETINVLFQAADRCMLYVPLTDYYTISVDITGGDYYKEQSTALYDIYNVAHNATVAIDFASYTGNDFNDPDLGFASWALRNTNNSGESMLTDQTKASFTLTSSKILVPNWKDPIVLDKDAAYANCYVYSPAIGNNYFQFDARRTANGRQINPYTVEAVWQDALENTSLTVINSYHYNKTTGILSILPNTTQSGSVLFVAKDKDNNVLGSWLIWLTPYYPEADGTGLMTRNLGALRDADQPEAAGSMSAPRSGYIYQRGRNMPFPLAFSSGFDYCNYIGGFEFTASSPLKDKEIPPGYVTNNWNRSSKSNDDPCPYGWRVPKQSELPTKLTVSGNVSYNAGSQSVIYSATGTSFPIYGIYYANSDQISVKYNAWSDNRKSTIYLLADGMLNVRVTRESDSYKPLILTGADENISQSSVLGGFVRCIKE